MSLIICLTLYPFEIVKLLHLVTTLSCINFVEWYDLRRDILDPYISALGCCINKNPENALTLSLWLSSLCYVSVNPECTCSTYMSTRGSRGWHRTSSCYILRCSVSLASVLLYTSLWVWCVRHIQVVFPEKFLISFTVSLLSNTFPLGLVSIPR